MVVRLQGGRVCVRACDVRDDVGSVFRCVLFVVGAAFVASAPATARALIGPSTLHAGRYTYIHTYITFVVKPWNTTMHVQAES